MNFPRSSGVLLHPTSLPGNYGTGDLGAAAYRFVDWLVEAGQTYWQMLPLGGIGPGNSPYMSSSAFAGNLLLIDLNDLAAQGWLLTEELRPMADAERVDYGAVYGLHLSTLRLAASRFVVSAHADYAKFCRAEKSWLDDYALFMALSERYTGLDWCDWPSALAQRDADAMQRAANELKPEIRFWKFCQWNFFRQWHALRGYANQRGIKIIGDMPIFIAYQSADVWARPDLFELTNGRPNVVAGVPPDYFSETGQRWGNPLYRWEAHAAEGYAWWIERLRKTMQQVDVVRIDHFRGFAAYWEIPASEPTAIRGRWVPGPGAALFQAIQDALGDLAVIAEDLGVITPDVVALREQFALPGMRVLQFAFGGQSDNPHLPHHYTHDLVVYSGTHDNDTALGWFNTASEHERSFARSYLATEAQEIHWDLIRAAAQSTADMAIYPLQDILGLGSEARMNTPGVADGNWAWRFKWEQVQPYQAARLAEIATKYRRNRM